MTFSNTEILNRIEKNVLKPYMEKPGYNDFYGRLKNHFPFLFENLMKLYGESPDFLYHLEDIIKASCKLFLKIHPPKNLISSTKTKTKGLCCGSQNEVGAVFYVDLFAGKLKDIQKRIPYLKELGITFVHLMPLFKTPDRETDGGYAVSSYRDVDPGLGTMNELRELAHILEENGISIVLDFVLNHTSDQHEWALRAKEGDIHYQNYYYMFNERIHVY
jgi:amylosucrase